VSCFPFLFSSFIFPPLLKSYLTNLYLGWHVILTMDH
jgi:hypothetical protein